MAFEDLLSQVDTRVRSALGGEILYTPGVGAPVTVRGVFDRAYQLVSLDQPGVSSTHPAVFLRLSELPSNPETDGAARITAAGTQYTIHTTMPDGLGGVLCLMHAT